MRIIKGANEVPLTYLKVSLNVYHFASVALFRGFRISHLLNDFIYVLISFYSKQNRKVFVLLSENPQQSECEMETIEEYRYL